jgi:transposase
MESRQLKALEIASTSRITQTGDAWLVPSQSSGTKYTVKLSPFSCSCPDFQKREQACKHLLAVLELIQHTATSQAIPTPEPVKKQTYKQEWAAYNQAQRNEKARLQELLFALCQNVHEPVQRMGRPRAAMADIIFASCLKVYGGMSGRRTQSDLREAMQRGYVSKSLHYNTISKYLERQELTPYLKDLITESSLPLKSVESDFAVDSSGFATGQFSRWFDAKYGEEKQEHEWVKVHVMCGVKTNVVTSVEVSEAHANDSPYLKPLLHTTIGNGFQVKELSADKGYDSFNNRCLVLIKGGHPFIPFREGEKNKPNPSDKGELWKRMYYFYKYNESVFNQHYHKRSNVESTFSMIKAKFGERLRSKTETAQVNEVLCKILAHNLCCVIQSIYELGIEPTFWNES